MNLPWWLDPRKIDFKRSWAVWLVVGLVLLAGVFVAGRHSIKPQVKEVVRIEYRDHIITRVVKVQAKKQVVYRERYVDPSGGVHEKETVNTDTNTTEKNATDTERVGLKVAEHTVSSPSPQWHAGALVGAQLHVDPLGASIVAGVHVEHRVFDSPFFVGAWGMYPVAAGGSLSMEW